MFKAGLCGALALVVASPAAAQSYRGVGFAGGSVGDGVSGYAGAVVSLPGAQLGNGLAVRGSVNAGEYRYDAAGVRIDAQYVGAEAALVYQFSGPWGWGNVSAGPRVTDTSLSPVDPANDRQGTRWDLGLQTDGGLNLDANWRLGWFGSVGVGDGAYQTRLSLGRLVDPESQTRLGLEASLQGDPRFTAYGAGAFVSRQIARDLEAQLSAGLVDQEGRSARPYASLGLAILF